MSLLDDIKQAIRLIEAMPKPDAFDLYGHDLADDQCYTFDQRKVNESIFGPEMVRMLSPDRKTLIVPRRRLLEIFHSMKAIGVDVRLEPRIKEPSNEEHTD